MEVKNFSFTTTGKGNNIPQQKKALYVAGKFLEAESFPVHLANLTCNHHQVLAKGMDSFESKSWGLAVEGGGRKAPNLYADQGSLPVECSG